MLVALGALAAGTGAAAHAGFSARVTNPSSGASSGTGLLADTIGGTTCTSSPSTPGGIGANVTGCPTYPLTTTPGASRVVTPASTGTLAPAPARLSTTDACGVQQLADTSGGGGNPGLVFNGVTYGEPGPSRYTDGPTAVGFDGTTGWAETLDGPPTPFYSSPGPQTFTIAAWFQTTGSGSIIGLTNAQGNTGQTMWDRHLWIDPAGHVVFGLYPNGFYELSSASTTATDYANGAWHLAVVTVSPLTATTATVLLFVDGTLVAGGVGDEAIPNADGNPAQAYGGWWHLGWSNVVQRWPDPPTSAYWPGSLADVAVFPTALTQTQTAALWGQTTQSGYAAQVATDSPQAFWPMQGNGSNLYTGAVPGITDSVTYRDASGNPGTNTGTAEGAMASDPAGPIGDSAALFDGTSAWIQTATGPPAAFYASPGPQRFSLAAWFKTTTSGSIIGFTDSQGDTGQTTWDRQLWVDPAGHVVFGLYPTPGDTFEISSAATTPASFADGAWHFVVVTVTPDSANVGTVRMYIDGALVAGSPRNEVIANRQTSQAYGGWWHLGWSNAAAGWPDGPSDPYWGGSLGQIAVFPSALSPNQVSGLAGAASAASYATAVTGGVATSNAYWPLDEQAGATLPCQLLGVTVQSGTGAGAACLVPAGAGPCPATPPVGGISVRVAVPVPLAPLTFTSATVAPVPAAAAGLHVSVAWALQATFGGFSAELDHAQGYVLL
jgi:hypothetical protein